MMRRRGFTLLEVLLALSIAAILLAAVVAALFGAIRLRRTAEQMQQRSTPELALRAAIRADLANAVVPAGVLHGPLLIESSGDDTTARDRLELYTTAGALSDEKPWPDVRRVEYLLDEESAGDDSEGLPFVRRETFNLLSDVEDETVRRDTVLIADATALSIECLDGETWVETWDSTVVDNANPTLVRLSITTAAGATLVVQQALIAEPRPVPASAGGS